MENYIWLGFAGALIALLFAFTQKNKVMSFSEGNDTMRKIAASIREGANAYLKHQYTTVFKVFLVVFVVLLVMQPLGISLNLMSMIGIIVMSGIVINDSILKIDTINRLRRGGMPTLRAILTAGHERLRPILMTSATTMFAVLPFLSRGDLGSDLQYPLSVTTIIGMSVGTLVSLFFVPLLYYVIYRRKPYR